MYEIRGERESTHFSHFTPFQNACGIERISLVRRVKNIVKLNFNISLFYETIF